MAKNIPACSEALLEESFPFVPPGSYSFEFIYHKTWIMFGKVPKLILHLQLIDDEMYEGLILHKYYNVKKLIGKPGVNGRFKVSPRSNFVRDYYRVCSPINIKRLDRIPLSRLKERIIQGKVRVVTTGYDQRDIPEPLQYSVVSEISS